MLMGQKDCHFVANNFAMTYRLYISTIKAFLRKNIIHVGRNFDQCYKILENYEKKTLNVPP